MADLDTKAADNFQPVHRAGYGDRLAFLMQWLTDHPDATLASGEGRVLLDEIYRVRLVAQANYHNMERLGAEIDRLRGQIAAVLALPSWYAWSEGGVEPADAPLGDTQRNGQYVMCDHVTDALGVPR